MRTLALALLVACGTPPADPPKAGEARPAASAAIRTAPQKLPDRFDLGRAATTEEIAAWDRDVNPTGAALPPGSGTVDAGKALYTARCAACHGLLGVGGIGPVLIAAEPKTGFAEDPKLHKTIGNYWPYVTTVFDYLRRAMPQTQPGSLTDDETYALVAYLLHANGAAPADFVANAEALRAFKMPTKITFVPDDRDGATTVR